MCFVSNYQFYYNKLQFSSLLRHLLDSYSSAVITASVDEFWRTVLNWLEQQCSLVALRRGIAFSISATFMDTKRHKCLINVINFSLLLAVY